MRKFIPLLFFVLIMLNACKIGDLFKKKDEPVQEPGETYKISVPVTVSPAYQGELVKYIKANGITEAWQSSDILAEVSGRVAKISTPENETVSAGDVILEIINDELLLKIQQAELQLSKSQAEYNAWKKLGGDANDELLKLQTGLKEAEINLNKLKLDLGKTVIRAPFNGVVTSLKISVGEQVTVGQKLCSLYDLEQVIVRANILESELSRLRKGASALIQVPAVPGKIYKGRVRSISPTIDARSHTCELLIELVNDGSIKNGMFSNLKISAERYPDKIIVYKDALLVRDGKLLVFVVDGEKARWQYVQTGQENENFVEITEGVEKEQLVVIDGNFSLSHDADVEIEETVLYQQLAEKF